MKFKTLLILFVILVAVVSVTMAQDTTEPVFPVTIVDESGAEYTFEEPVERIICLSPACIDDLYVLGIDPIAIADWGGVFYRELHEDDIPEDLPLISTGGGFQPDIEQILDLQPEVVIGQIGVIEFLIEPLGEAGISVLLAYPNNVEETIGSLLMTATITGELAQAEEAIAQFEEKLASYQETVPGDASIMVVSGNVTSETIFIETPDAQNCAMFIEYELADCPFELPDNAGMFGGFGYAEFTFEAILEVDPQFVFFLGFDALGEAAPEVLETLNENPLWNALSAVQSEQVFSASPTLYSGSGGISLLGRALDDAMLRLYPDALPEPEATEEAAEG